jgi:hypothetical protein
MKRARSQLRRRTAAQRAAIDACADAWPRPLSAAARRALLLLRKGAMHRDRLGFHLIVGNSSDHVPVGTMRSLARRGLAKLGDFENGAEITAAGRKEARR